MAALVVFILDWRTRKWFICKYNYIFKEILADCDGKVRSDERSWWIKSWKWRKHSKLSFLLSSCPIYLCHINLKTNLGDKLHLYIMYQNWSFNKYLKNGKGNYSGNKLVQKAFFYKSLSKYLYISSLLRPPILKYSRSSVLFC